MVIEAIDVGASTPLCINEVLYDKKKKKQFFITFNIDQLVSKQFIYINFLTFCMQEV
jgi:hypothetical protein